MAACYEDFRAQPRASSQSQYRQAQLYHWEHRFYKLPGGPMSAIHANESLYMALADVDEIRLLHLQPSSELDESPVRCTLQHVKLSNKPRYEALSYMWGPKDSRQIQINGKPCDVRENLWQALVHLRDTHSTRVLWIDAVCINQDDIEERNYQVSQMGTIYSKAWKVVSWLGPEASASELGIWALNNYVKFLSQPVTESWINQLNAIKALCHRKYWTRLWIIQEILSAKKVLWPWSRETKGNWMLLVICGRKSFDLASIHRLVDEARSGIKGRDHQLRSQANDIMMDISRTFAAHLSRAYQPAKQRTNTPFGRLPLMWLISTYGASECEDHRGKIFGLRSLAMDCCQQASKVDYPTPLLELHKVLVEHYMAVHSSLGHWYHVPEMFHHIHQFLKITPENVVLDAVPIFPDNSSVTDSKLDHEFPFFTSGKVRSRIRYLHHAGQDRGALKNTTTLYSEVIEQQLKCCREQSLGIGQLPVALETDLVQSFDGEGKAYATIHRSRLRRQNGHQSVSRSTKERLHIVQDLDQSEPNEGLVSLVQILDDLSKTLSNHCSLALDDSGLMIIVPSCSKVGDLVCQFKGTNIILIIRPRKDGKCIRHRRSRNYTKSVWYRDPLLSFRRRPVCELIGRAVSLIHGSPHQLTELPGRNNRMFRLENQGEANDMVCLSLDTNTLQLLTAVSNIPDAITPRPPQGYS